MSRQKVILRADGGDHIGLGHISRCLALAELLLHEFDIKFITRANHPGLSQLIGNAAFEIILLPPFEQNIQHGHELSKYVQGDEIVVLDGYHFTIEYERELKKLVGAVVFIDDIPFRQVVADVIINFCGGINSKSYFRELYTKVFTGLDYVFLRSPFLRNPPNKTLNNRLFINMGGTDPDNNTSKILASVLSSQFGGKIDIVVGTQYKYTDALGAVIQKTTTCTIHMGLTAEEIFRLMCNCSIAILPPSTVALEFLSTGGLAFLHQTADNQTLLNKYLQDRRLALDFRNFASLVSSNDMRASFETHLNLQKEAFSGTSLKRVESIFTKVAVSCRIKLRKARVEDTITCFEWANDMEARKYSYSTENISWEQHVSWFQKKINDPGCFYFIASIGTADVGQIRFDLVEASAYQISYSLDKNWRGKGLSGSLLLKAIQELGNLASPKKIIGFVQEKNIASIKAFQGAGFNSLPTNKYPDSLLFQLS